MKGIDDCFYIRIYMCVYVDYQADQECALSDNGNADDKRLICQSPMFADLCTED